MRGGEPHQAACGDSEEGSDGESRGEVEADSFDDPLPGAEMLTSGGQHNGFAAGASQRATRWATRGRCPEALRSTREPR